MKKLYIPVVLIAVVTTLAYSPVLFNFFCGDDFVHLDWLSKAIVHPAMLLHNFNHNWLDIPTFRFYRPLISVFMFTDYLIWRTNGFGFHLTNVLFHIANSILVFAISLQLLKLSGGTAPDELTEPTDKSCNTMPFPPIAGLLFALYPLHCEAVSWITGRVDDIVATFYFLTVWLYIKWRSKRSNSLLILSLVSMALALTSKEMAVTLPPLLFALDFLLPNSSEKKKTLLEKFKISALSTLPFWIGLGLYFVVRRIALGTFVGGYDDSLFFIANMREFLLGWRNGLTMLAQPANQLIIGSHNIGLIAWDIGLTFAVVGIFKALKDSESKKLFPFLIVWIILALAPVYKIFSISIDLQSSRLAYLVTAPLSMLLAWGLAEGAKSKQTKMLFSVAAVVFLCGSFFLLFKNNDAWAEAGRSVNAMRDGLIAHYEHVDGDPQTLLLGMPDQQKGAYVGRNAVPEMLQRPQFPRDLKNCIAFNTALPILPFGYLRQSIVENASKVNVLLFDQKNKKWIQVAETLKPGSNGTEATGSEKKLFFGPAQTNKNQIIKIENIDHENKDFVFVETAETPATEMRGKAQEPVLTFINELTQTTDSPLKISGHQLTVNGQHGFIFPLRACPYWVFANTTNKIEIQLPASIIVKSAKLLGNKTLMPQLTFANSGFLGSKGFTHLSQKDSVTTLTCASNDVAGARSFALEIIRPNLFLATNDQNAPEQSKLQLRMIKGSGKTSTITLNRKDFQGAGIYQARLFALDESGEPIGVAGDHINISVEPD